MSEPPRSQAPAPQLAGGPAAFTGLTASGRFDPQAIELLLQRQAVVCLGETHDRAWDHVIQAELVRRLGAAAKRDGVPFAVGFEMLPQAAQPALDAFAAGSLTEAQFLDQSNWKASWGFPYDLYRPVFEAARASGAALLALNAPRALTRAIAKRGLAGLDPETAETLPELKLDDAEHRAFFARAMGGHTGFDSETWERFYAAQVTWDESMASSAAQWLQARSGAARIVVIAGAGHCHQSAVPRRIARRSGQRGFAVRTLLPEELQEERASEPNGYQLLLEPLLQGVSR